MANAQAIEAQPRDAGLGRAAKYWLPLLLAALATAPTVYLALTGDIDSSWMCGIHKAKLLGLVFGRDIVFTYGPLGYLLYPVYVGRSLWFQALLFSLATHVHLISRMNRSETIPTRAAAVGNCHPKRTPATIAKTIQ